MPLQLTPQHEALIERIISETEYRDPDQVITLALRQMAKRESKLRELRAEIQIGIDQLDRGEGVEWTRALMDQLREEARAMRDRPDPNAVP